MRTTKEQLKNFGLFDKLPEPLKKMEDGQYFVFYYDVDEENAKLKIYEFDIYKEVNVSLYRGIQSKAQKYGTFTIRLGFFTDTFETRDGLFYEFLRTYNSAEDVHRFYDFAIEQDKGIQVDVSTNAITNIYTSDDFRRSISYFCPTRLQSIMFVYDMVNEAFKRRLSKPLYGELLKKVVTLIRFDGGVLPEVNGSLRFMVVGENAQLTPEQQKNLEDAKVLVRSMQRLEDIYLHTGWVFSTYDGKWRTNIDDSQAKIDPTFLYDVDGRKMYIPKGSDAQEVFNYLKNPNQIYNYSYKGRLIEVLSHPTLYKYYPDLALVPIVYFYGNAKSSKPQFYYSPNDRGGFIIIDGFKECGDSLSILLHEIQHAIQHKEGFATGGNEFLAQFVASLGGSKVRQIFSSINRIENYFRENIREEEGGREQLIRVLKSELGKNDYARMLKNAILEKINDPKNFKEDISNINFLLIQFVAENGDFSTSNLATFLEEKFGSIVFDLFENITEAYQSAKYFQEKLASERYVNEDISQILFKSYENLYGELESRSTQASRCVESAYKNYFYLTKWENAPLQNIVVIDGLETIIESDKIKGAVETKDDTYILHFEKGFNCVPFLHELGHIVYDALVKLGHYDKINEEFEKTFVFDNTDEFFVAKFMAYLRDRIEDESISEDLFGEAKLSANEKINEILDEFFVDVHAGENLQFIQTMLEE